MSIHFSSKKAAAFWKVAPKLGINLPDAIRTDRLTPADLSGMLRNCDACWNTRKCASWVEDAKEAAMPGFCISSTALNGLAAPRTGADATGF
ncbi:MAG: DUF6455 family protein [Pararhodobacter sp.]